MLTIQTSEQQYYLTKLLGYNYEILYRPGKLNAASNALSRKSDDKPGNKKESTSFMELSAPPLAIFDDIKREQTEAPELQILNDSILPPGWTTSDGVFLYEDKI